MRARLLLGGLRLVSALLLAAPVLAQQSASHRLEESVFNEGGHPEGGAILTSTGYRITLDAIGDGPRPILVTGPSWRMNAGFIPVYRPPLEVLNLRLEADLVTLAWDPERSVGSYNLYRGALSDLSGLGYGSCQQQEIADETTTDATVPAAGNGYFYLVTAENRLNEEGIKGFDSSGAERLGTFCP